MGPKKQASSVIVDEEECGDHVSTELEVLREKLQMSEQTNKKLEHQLRTNQEESMLQRDDLVRTYQRRINEISTEKDTQIRQLEISANNVPGNDRTSGHSNASLRNKWDVPLPRQMLFDGTISWESFICQFEAMSSVCQWDDHERLFRLKNSLRGEAAEYVFKQASWDILDSYSEMKSSLAIRFQEKRSTASYLAELENLKYLRDKETVAEYVANVKRLVMKGYPTADSVTRETISLRHFLKGLQDTQAALFIGMQNPTTIDQAREQFDNYISIKDDVRNPRIRSVHPKQDDYVTEARLQEFGRDVKTHLGKKIEQLAQQINAKGNVTKTTSRDKNMRDVECYNCRRRGHIARDCKSGKAQAEN